MSQTPWKLAASAPDRDLWPGAPLSGQLRQIIEAATVRKHHQGKPYSLDGLTVLSQSDPYRADTLTGHRLGAWFKEQVDQFVPGGAAVHLRGLHYRLVAAAYVLKPDGKSYRNTDEDWKWLQERASWAARWLLYVSFDRIVDGRNAAPEIYVPDEGRPPLGFMARGDELNIPGLEDLMPGPAHGWFVARQPYRICFIGEKSSLGDVLRPIAERIGAELALPTGEISATMLAEIVARAAEDGRPCAVLYFSDFDPSGRQMLPSVGRKIQALRDLRHPDLDLEVHQVCLTLAQVIELDLPSTPLKAKEQRASKWIEAMNGREQTEIDALAALRPDALRRIAEEAIAPFYDATLEARTLQVKRGWTREAVGRMQAQPAFADAQAGLESARKDVLEAAAKLEVAQEEAFAKLSDTVLPPIKLPEPELAADPPEPLFTTDDDFLTATLKLKAFKAHEE